MCYRASPLDVHHIGKISSFPEHQCAGKYAVALFWRIEYIL